MIDPELRFGELFMNGRIGIVEGWLYEVVALASQNLPRAAPGLGTGGIRLGSSAARGARGATPPWPRQTTLCAQGAMRHIIMISTQRIYQLFLDADLQYSCAYFERAGESLEEAQLAKKRHIAAKLAISPGERVLDIGSGFGGLANYLAR
jgi:cyclopropane-fatty-acyl-phospholipid synthase